jgi:hypothetical protein
MSHREYEKILNALSDYEIYYTLKAVIDSDCYLWEVQGDKMLETFFDLMSYFDLIWLTSDDRFLLTNKGEKLLQQLAFDVEISQKPGKIKKNKNIWKPQIKN